MFRFWHAVGTPTGKIANFFGRPAIGPMHEKCDLCKEKKKMRVKPVLLAAAILLAAMTACGRRRSGAENENTMNATELNDAEFRQKIYDYEKNPQGWKYEGERPALIDFYATWCGPCKMMAPVMENIAAEYEGRVDVYKVDVDKEQRLAALFGVRSIPTFIFIPLEGEPRHASGAMDISQMRKIVDIELLGKRQPVGE